MVLHIADQVGIFRANDGQTISRRMEIGPLEGVRKIGCDYYVERHPTVSSRVGSMSIGLAPIWSAIVVHKLTNTALCEHPTNNLQGNTWQQRKLLKQSLLVGRSSGKNTPLLSAKKSK